MLGTMKLLERADLVCRRLAASTQNQALNGNGCPRVIVPPGESGGTDRREPDTIPIEGTGRFRSTPLIRRAAAPRIGLTVSRP